MEFNRRLFNSFTSRKAKIIPTLSNDWIMQIGKYKKLTGFSLYSKKLNQTIYNVNYDKFTTFCEDNNILIDNLKVKATLIISKNHSIYTEKMYNKWSDAKESSRPVSKFSYKFISKKDWKAGNKYLTHLGKEEIYLGKRYVCSIEQDVVGNIEPIITKISLKHYNLSGFECDSRYTRDLGNVYTSDKCDELLQEIWEEDISIVYFEKTNNKPKSLELDEIKGRRNSFANIAIAIGKDGKAYSLDGLKSFIIYDMSIITKYLYNIDDRKDSWGYDRSDFNVDKLFRFKLV